MSGKSKRNVERALRAHYRAERGAPDAEAKAATLAAVRAAVASERPAGERGGRDDVRRVRGRSGALHPPARVGSAACARGDHGGGLLAVERHGTRLLGRLGHAGGGDGARRPTRPAGQRHAPRVRARVRLPLRLPRGRAWRGSSCWGARTSWRSRPSRSRRRSRWEPIPSRRSCTHACPTSSRARAPCSLRAAARSSQALPLACVWTLLVMAGAYAVHALAPDAYAQASTWAWALVAVGSLGWAAREVRTWLGSIAAGLDVFAPASTPR